jgi:hypothetical protein
MYYSNIRENFEENEVNEKTIFDLIDDYIINGNGTTLLNITDLFKDENDPILKLHREHNKTYLEYTISKINNEVTDNISRIKDVINIFYKNNKSLFTFINEKNKNYNAIYEVIDKMKTLNITNNKKENIKDIITTIAKKSNLTQKITTSSKTILEIMYGTLTSNKDTPYNQDYEYIYDILVDQLKSKKNNGFDNLLVALISYNYNYDKDNDNGDATGNEKQFSNDLIKKIIDNLTLKQVNSILKNETITDITDDDEKNFVGYTLQQLFDRYKKLTPKKNNLFLILSILLGVLSLILLILLIYVYKNK